MLTDRLSVIGEELAGRRAHYATRAGSADKFALSRLRNQIRMKEAEYRDLVRIVTALERRFVLPTEPISLPTEPIAVNAEPRKALRSF
jgi:hypothetical protein